MAKKITDVNGNVYVQKKPFYKKWWFWLLLLILIGVGIGSQGGKQKKVEIKTTDNTSQENKKDEPKKEEVKKDDTPIEYKSALKKAEAYSNNMYMSKKAIFKQLTSEYGEKFSEEAAKYAIDNLKADYNKNALKKAESYQKNMSMSPAAIRDQLTSEYGEQFTLEEADYAIQNLPK